MIIQNYELRIQRFRELENWRFRELENFKNLELRAVAKQRLFLFFTSCNETPTDGFAP